MISVVGQNSVWQKTYALNHFHRDEVNRVRDVYESAAGKGANLIRCLRCLDVPATLVAYAGGANGDKFTRACQDDGLNCRFVDIANETRICTTILEDKGNSTTEIIEPAPTITPAERDAFKSTLGGLLADSLFLAIAGTAVQGESPDCYRDFIEEAHRHGVPVLLDSYTEHGRKALAAGPDILKINLMECEALAGGELRDRDSKMAFHLELRETYGIKWIVITNGKEGLEGSCGSELQTFRPAPVSAVNPIGSGDSVSGGLLYGLIQCVKSGPVPWEDEVLFRQVMKYAVASGTANCLNKKPGHIEQADFKNVFKTIEVS